MLDDRQKRQIRANELARFDRWFIETPMGRAYCDRNGRARTVRDDEYAAWRASVEQHVDTMIARVPLQVIWAIGGLLIVVFGGRWLMTMLGIAPQFRGPAITFAVIVVEMGTIGIEAWDYIQGWRGRRDTVEAAVAGRAPLPIDPRRIGDGRNWFNIALYVLITVMVGSAFLTSHGRTESVSPLLAGLLVLGVPLAWGLHFGGRWYDGRLRDRLRHK